MLFYYYLSSVIMLLLIAFIGIRSFLFRKSNIPILKEAIKNENAGLFEEAIKNYEDALIELSKVRYYRSLRIEIFNKIKLLHSILEYQKNTHFIR